MKIKRVLQGTALTALAAAAWMGAGSTDASAADFSTANITKVSTDGIEVNFTDKELMVSVLKIGKGKSEAKITSWDVYEGGSATIDLSKLKATADSYIAIKTDSTDPIVLHISPSNSKYKAEYYAIEQKVNITNGTEGMGYEYRTAFSDWQSLSLTGFGRQYQYQGATIYVRENSDLHPPIISETKISDVTIKTKPEDMTMYDIGALPGKEVKFNIAKEANGPSVAADYTKGIVKIKEGLEWRFVTPDTVGTAVSAGATDAKPGRSVNDIVSSGNEGILEVRTAAKGSEKKGKVASKWTRVKVQKLEDIQSKVGASAIADLTTGGAIKEVNLIASGSAVVKAAYDYDSAKDKIKSIVVTNNFGSAVEYVIGTDTPKVDAKVKKIADGKTAKIKTTETGNLYIRVAGDKKTQTWVTDFANTGALSK